jgi:hypothetical protein
MSLSFCSENNLNFKQASKILMVAENFLNTCATDVQYSQELSVSYFRQQVMTLLAFGLSPPCQVNTILLEPTAREGAILLEVKILEQFLLFFVKNFVRHLSLYQTVLSTHQPEEVQFQKIAIQTPLCFPSLMESPSASETIESPEMTAPEFPITAS